MLNKIIIICLFAFSFLNADIKQVEVLGTGTTKQEAISNALVEALSRVNGVEIDSDTKSTASNEEFSSNKNDETNEASFSESSMKKDISAKTNGAIKTYEVLSASKNENGWEVELLVDIPVYKELGLSTKNRRKIAVMPFYTAIDRFYIGSRTYNGAEVSEMITQVLTNNISQSRKFAVVDRTYTKDMASELALLDSDQVAITQKVKLGQKLGADYLLVGTIQNASFYKNKSRNQLLGTNTSKSEIELIIDYRVLVVGSSQIKFSDTIKTTIDTSASRGSNKMVLLSAVEKVAGKITNKLLEGIYPIKILNISYTGNIVLNQGGNSLKEGTILDVMHLGEKMFDPYTKEPLGQMEDKVGQIEITRVNAKVSYAKRISGNLGLMSKNDICRRQTKDNSQGGMKSTVEIGQGGGVRLPFD